MACLDEVEETARRIKAVNTIVNANGRLQGYNTDVSGAIRALQDKTPASRAERSPFSARAGLHAPWPSGFWPRAAA